MLRGAESRKDWLAEKRRCGRRDLWYRATEKVGVVGKWGADVWPCRWKEEEKLFCNVNRREGGLNPHTVVQRDRLF